MSLKSQGQPIIFEKRICFLHYYLHVSVNCKIQNQSLFIPWTIHTRHKNVQGKCFRKTVEIIHLAILNHVCMDPVSEISESHSISKQLITLGDFLILLHRKIFTPRKRINRISRSPLNSPYCSLHTLFPPQTAPNLYCRGISVCSTSFQEICKVKGRKAADSLNFLTRR